MSSNIQVVKSKIIGWLKEEACSPEERNDPNAFFNIGAKIGNFSCNIVQSVQKQDSFAIATNLILAKEQIVMLQEMTPEKRQKYFFDLRIVLASNNELGEFAIKPQPPERIETIFVTSKPIYYDGLTKDRFMNSIFPVLKAIMISVMLLEQHAGKIPIKKDGSTKYSV
jgi:hypothetical protein